ncbi:M48 family metallopeptidase [Helicobacter pullorum]|uniref:Metalloprotease n=1 Tax=Helicobacter pullorum TaxID=35818 RepID=A0A377PYF3_9HELI|nr:YgjP-like metallopeptidase domain-containing protein [Helicobacter pullorum]STQ87926.1 metalloprotease [Helicobacter pullorum]
MPPYTLKIIQKRNYKNLKMHFCNSSTLLISAPKHITKKECLKFLEENRQWIDTQYHSLQEKYNINLPRNQFFIFGEWKNFSDSHTQSLWEQSLSQDSTKHTKNQLIAYYKNMLDSYLQIRIPHFANIMNLFPNKILYGKSYKQLACCYKHTKNLRFSIRLALMPHWVIDSIIIHELAHLRFPHHQKEFWNLISLYDKEPKKLHQWLKENHTLLYFLHHNLFKS